MADLIEAVLVYDGAGDVIVPSQMGVPRSDQMQGTPLERLAELSGRTCYDSLGKGRSSADFHAHIAEVGHLNVYEHGQVTIDFRCADLGCLAVILEECSNRAGVHVIIDRSQSHPVRVTANLRAVIEWPLYWPASLAMFWQSSIGHSMRLGLLVEAEHLDPLFPEPAQLLKDDPVAGGRIVEPEHDEEKWVSLFLQMSRGCSHEMVRHRFRTALSQRSTRYVDESQTPWVEHPLLSAFLADGGVLPEETDPKDITFLARGTYGDLCELLESWLAGRGVDKLTARKQARGAARGYLGNALQTEMIFSASIAQWRRMLKLRASVHADAEIRVLFGKILRELKRSRYADRFDDITTAPSPDGIGGVAVFAS